VVFSVEEGEKPPQGAIPSLLILLPNPKGAGVFMMKWAEAKGAKTGLRSSNCLREGMLIVGIVEERSGGGEGGGC